MTLKETNEKARELAHAGVTSKEKLMNALPVLCAGLRRVRCMRESLNATAKTLTELTDKCAAYALDHETVFDDDSFITRANGVTSGDITFNDVTYHLAAGYGEPKRDDGSVMSQDFIESLPKEWTKAKLELDTTGIKRLGVTFQQLEEQGLYRPAKNVWSVKNDSFGDDGDADA